MITALWIAMLAILCFRWWDVLVKCFWHHPGTEAEGKQKGKNRSVWPLVVSFRPPPRPRNRIDQYEYG